jgi:hypothetical protein
LYEEEKKKKEIALKENNDAKRNQAKQDVKKLLGKNEKKKKKVDALEPPGAKVEAPSLAPVLERKSLPGIKPLGSLSSNLKPSVVEVKQDEGHIGHSTDVATADNSRNSNALSMKSSSILGMIESLRAATESSGNLVSFGSVTPAIVDVKISERPKYREEPKSVAAEEISTLSNPGSTRKESNVEAKEQSNSRSEGEKSFPRQNSIPPSLGTGNNVKFEHQERRAKKIASTR